MSVSASCHQSWTVLPPAKDNAVAAFPELHAFFSADVALFMLTSGTVKPRTWTGFTKRSAS